ncbi:extracellular solute-binding protein [Microbacterium sp. zg.Y1090]|uniref:extracellular solute-binding protein n=1 Tax=Microbacterium TaxID=33882 RepID=UPI00214BE313|nr:MULTISPECIES: extracellular solute-binding protein [unclassified Microbacterium]MCR2812675.1 extracellular solute-binding protein [Microbacterium sp. zg.Y1084]MCR2817529.1 extracellular solute-binding protein [Microbacterium sp. zg.Y1090]MDL5485829.1 extracellular solute-binding protein [Microbacterium sp. zg-Y1211]WIM28988.1 extracellular solute-binding protein [Microbacterium sp. zg-Y1090]
MFAARKKSLAILGATAATALLLTGCAGGDTESDTGDAGAGASDATLIVYTNSNSDGRGEWLQAQAEEAGFDIEIVGLGGADLTNRIIAEKNNPVGDVVFGLNNMFFEQLKAEEAIAAYEPSWSGEVPADAGDPADGAYWPLVQQAIVTVYDENSVSDAPADIEELATDEAYQGRYEVNPALGQATPQLVLAGILSRHLDEDGDLGVSDEGWEIVESYYGNGSPVVEGTDLYARITRDEVDFGVLPSSGIAARDEEYGTSTGLVVPEYGVPYVTEQIAVINGSANEQRAQEFIDWFGSAEVQGAFAAEFNAMPVNEGAVEQANPDVVAQLAEIPRQDIDFGFVSEHLGDWVEKVTLEYIG